MSMKLMVRVLEEVALSRPQTTVLLAMAENANDDGSRCFPSVDLIAWRAGFSRRQVQRIITQLRELEVIEEVAKANRHRPVEYVIHVDRAPSKPPFKVWREANGRPVDDHPESSGTGAETATRDDTDVTPNGSPRDDTDVTPKSNLGVTSGVVRGDISDTRGDISDHLEVTSMSPEPVLDPVKDPVRNQSSDRATPSRRKPTRTTPVPDSFEITDEIADWGERHGIPRWMLEDQVDAFLDHHRSKHNVFADWTAAFRTWIRKARQYGTLAPPAVANGRASPPGRMKHGGMTPQELMLSALEDEAEGR
jgi:hypothetical protein